MNRYRHSENLVVRGVAAVLCLAVALILHTCGFHIAGAVFLVCAIFWIWPRETGIVLSAVFSAAMIIVSLLVPWWLAHKAWVWIFG